MRKVYYSIFAILILGAWGSAAYRTISVPGEYEKKLQMAVEAHEKEYYYESLQWLEQTDEVEHEPNFDEEMLRLDCYKKLGNEDAFVTQCKFLIEEYPENEAGYIELMNYYYNAHQWEKLYSHMPEWSEKFPQSTQIQELAKELDRKYDYASRGYFDVKYATDHLINVRQTEYVNDGEESWIERKICRMDGTDVFDEGYKDIVISEDRESCFVQMQDDKWKMVNTSNYLLARNVARQFQSIGALSVNNIATAELDGAYYFINNEMKVSDIAWDYAGNFHDNVNAVMKDGKWAIVHSDDWNQTDTFPYTDIRLNSYGYCSMEKLCVVADSNGYRILNTESGEYVSDQKFEELKAFESNQPTVYRQGNQWGFVNNKGQIYLEAMYEDAKPYVNGYAAVKKNGLWGYVDCNGDLIVEPQFMDALNMTSDGIAYVQNESGYWDKIILYKLYYGT